MPPEARIEHRYPQALAFLRRHGADALVILDDLVAHATPRGDRLVVQASVREIAARLSVLSKDTVHRRLRQLHRAGVIQLVATATAFEPPTYMVNLTGTGIAITSTRTRSS